MKHIYGIVFADNSTETFWESGDEDRNKTKSITITTSQTHHPKMIYVHIDNSRDLSNKVASITFNAGPTVEDLKKIKQVSSVICHLVIVCHQIFGLLCTFITNKKGNVVNIITGVQIIHFFMMHLPISIVYNILSRLKYALKKNSKLYTCIIMLNVCKLTSWEFYLQNSHEMAVKVCRYAYEMTVK